ncbi:hypothetical protein EV649_1411 [Kribbella sp. VKM Ac-2569]|uniref:hypothetical protein n=1 Tax=Kribbella sp. VKM Ac-2569 TaxID=2512220 RepID=UPI00102B2B75|nr:hypothetical protein [Kribbella sp. VKM Ac-2569]RZT27640.1 hypothetical protein EV649_1411 [Kribbella sp. VKM Ac-2569]
MSVPLASFRELKGIGPATEARLHESGIYTWETLAAAAAALASVHGEGETLRDVAHVVAARGAEEDDHADGPGLPGGERVEAFVVRMALTGEGDPQRCEVTHVRTMAEQTWAGWTPAQLVGFIEEKGSVQAHKEPNNEANSEANKEVPRRVPTSRRRREAALGEPLSLDHDVVLDAGKVLGGSSRDIDLVVTNTGAAGGDFRYQATLSARRYGNGEGWTEVGHGDGIGSAAHEVALKFPAVDLATGIHSLQLLLRVNLAAPASRPPALVLA